jgi:hypothetical protein
MNCFKNELSFEMLIFEYSKQGTPRHRRIRRNIHDHSIILLDEGDVACKLCQAPGQNSYPNTDFLQVKYIAG